MSTLLQVSGLTHSESQKMLFQNLELKGVRSRQILRVENLDLSCPGAASRVLYRAQDFLILDEPAVQVNSAVVDSENETRRTLPAEAILECSESAASASGGAESSS